MTVSTSQGRQFTVNKHVEMSMRYAGLLGVKQTPTEPEYQHGRDQMQVVMHRLEAEGHPARSTMFFKVTMTADTFQYTLPTWVIDVLNPAMYIDQNNPDPDRADGETQIELITQQAYTLLSGKSSKGRPYKMDVDRTADAILVSLWPIPDASGAVVRFIVHRSFHDTDDGLATLDLRNYWAPYVHSALAARLAQSASLDERARALGREAEGLLKKAKMKATQRPGRQSFVAHRGGWN